jgi:hypothetical protein
MAVVDILKVTPRQVVVRAIGTGTFFCNLITLCSLVNANASTGGGGANGKVLQSLTLANANATITDIIYSVSGGTPLIQRGNYIGQANVFHIGGGDGDLRFTQEYGFSIGGATQTLVGLAATTTAANSNIIINFNGAVGTIMLGIAKGEGFTEPDLQNLEAWNKP